jgi:NADH-quinone oxidoreductase subunit A
MMEIGPVLPVLLFAASVLALALVLLGMSHFFNPKRAGPVKRMPYESGMDPFHDARRRFDVRFHLLAIAFLVFDVELLFLYPWAVATRPAPVAGPVAAASAEVEEEPTVEKATIPPPLGIETAVKRGWIESRDMVFTGVMIFLVLLALGFVYDWRKGVFQWR